MKYNVRKQSSAMEENINDQNHRNYDTRLNIL